MALALDYALQLCLFCPLMLFSARFERFEQQNKEEELKKPRKLAISIENNGWAMCEPEKGKRKYSPLEAQQREKLGHGRLRNALRALMNIYCKLLSNKLFFYRFLLSFLFTDALPVLHCFCSPSTGLSQSLARNASRQDWTSTRFCPVIQKCVKHPDCWTNTV